MARTVIDPVTRLGGPLRLEVTLDGGAVGDAWTSGTMYRGFESLLVGRDPRDAWLLAQRICGTCNGVHALASVRAVEQALGVILPPNARLIRNLLTATQHVANAVLHFYAQHALDWVDLSGALAANPTAAAGVAATLSDWPNATDTYFKSVQDRLATFAGSGQLGTFAGGYWGHPAYHLSPEANLVIFAHYIEALDWQRGFMRLHAMLGGKSPHPQTFLVGGMALAPTWGGPAQSRAGEHPQQVDKNAPAALSKSGLAAMQAFISEAAAFVTKVYLPDVILLAKTYPEWLQTGRGIGNYLAFGEYPEADGSDARLLLPRGRVMDRDLTTTQAVDQSGVGENTAHAWYADGGGDAAFRHPLATLTVPSYQGPALPLTTLEGSDRYSWIKAARYQEQAVETGALARMLVGLVEGRDEIRSVMEPAISGLGGPDALFSTMGRVIARAAEAQVLLNRMPAWVDQLRANFADGDLSVAVSTQWDPALWPAEAEGSALGESAGGAVGHWLRIRNRRIADYQVVDASTWNASPRDVKGRRGAIEEALMGTPVADPARPVEILRTLHSFDPCPACAVHAVGLGGRQMALHVGGGAR